MIKTAAQILAELGEETPERGVGRPVIYEDGCINGKPGCNEPNRAHGLCNRCRRWQGRLDQMPYQSPRVCWTCGKKVQLKRLQKPPQKERVVCTEHRNERGDVCLGSGKAPKRKACQSRAGVPWYGACVRLGAHKIHRDKDGLTWQTRRPGPKSPVTAGRATST